MKKMYFDELAHVQLIPVRTTWWDHGTKRVNQEAEREKVELGSSETLQALSDPNTFPRIPLP